MERTWPAPSGCCRPLVAPAPAPSSCSPESCHHQTNRLHYLCRRRRRRRRRQRALGTVGRRAAPPPCTMDTTITPAAWPYGLAHSWLRANSCIAGLQRRCKQFTAGMLFERVNTEFAWNTAQQHMECAHGFTHRAAAFHALIVRSWKSIDDSWQVARRS